jgi:DNA polymerase-1
VYAIDKAAAEICRDMSVNGFAFDAERAAMLSASLQGAEAGARFRANEAAGIEFNPFSVKQLHHVFFTRMRAPVFFVSELTGKPSLGVDTLRAYAACKDPALQVLALAVLEVRRARKVRSTYVDRVLRELTPDHRVHPSWLNYGAISGRWACQGPNLMNLPRPENDPTHGEFGGVRSVYVAPKGRKLVAFDMSQLEMRIAAYASGDPAMIAACEGSDLHAANAVIAFGEQFSLCSDPVARKALRTIAKSAGFAICYMAEASTVYARIVASGQAPGVKLRQVEAMLTKMRKAFHVYYSWQARGLLDCVRTGYVETPLIGRRRQLGHDPSPTEAANFPIQGGAADFMNLRIPELVRRVRAERLDALIVAQVHDSVVHECADRHVERLSQLCHEVFEAPITIASSGKALTCTLPIDLEVSERWH